VPVFYYVTPTLVMLNANYLNPPKLYAWFWSPLSYTATYSAGCATGDVTGQGGLYKQGNLFTRLIQSIINVNYD
jgi:hypothetical protein